jgi:peptidoglycan/LPS O-acetylase OafA/YrhL
MAVSPSVPAHESSRVRGLDAWRFWCALWVVFGHFGFLPLIDGVDLGHFAGRVTRALYNSLVSGPAAVIVFFVISGFCIHYPYRRATSISPVAPFYARRYLRILIPVGAAMLISNPLGYTLDLLGASIIWSLVCEEIYYLLYPVVFLRLRNRFGWRPMIAVSYVVSIGLAMTNRTGEYPALGPQLTWLVGLPCWLLGCDLAESYDGLATAPRSRLPIVAWRLGALGLSMIACTLQFHSPIRYPLTLNAFAFYVYFWLRNELAAAKDAPVGWAERAGVFSYSLYLMHPAAEKVWEKLHVPKLGSGVTWIFMTLFIVAFAYAFYLVVERPSHRFARRVFVWMQERHATAPGATSVVAGEERG